MTQKFKTALASPLFMVMAILISVETLFLMISTGGRSLDFLSMGANGVLVAAAWIFFATKNSENTPSAAWMCVKIWAIAKAGIQLLLALVTFINGIFMLIGGFTDFDGHIGLVILGLLAMIFGTVLRVLLALIYFILFNFISKVKKNAVDDAETEITTKYVACIFGIAGFEALKIISFFIIRAVLKSAFDSLTWMAWLDDGFLLNRVLGLANYYDIFDFVMLFLTGGVTIALTIITFIWVKGNFSISKSSMPKSIKDIAE